MPAKSVKQRRLMAAAEHGADFPMAEKVRESMTTAQMHDFAATPESDLPKKVGPPKRSFKMGSRAEGHAPSKSGTFAYDWAKRHGAAR